MFWFGFLLFIGFCALVIVSSGFSNFFGLLCLLLLMPAIGSLTFDTDHLTLETRRYRAVAIWGTIFFLGWGAANFIDM